MEKYILLWLAGINLLALVLCGIDKWKARRDRWRIPEKTLFLSAILGGSVGLLVGMHLFRHKTKHWYFRLGFPAMLVAQVALLVAAAIFLL